MTLPLPGTPLSARELEVLRLAAEGLTNGQIAVKLTLSVHTVKTHMRRLAERLGAENRAQCVALGHELGLLRTTGVSEAQRLLAQIQGGAVEWAVRSDGPRGSRIVAMPSEQDARKLAAEPFEGAFTYTTMRRLIGPWTAAPDA